MINLTGIVDDRSSFFIFLLFRHLPHAVEDLCKEVRAEYGSFTKEFGLARKEFCRLGKELYSVEEEFGLAKLLSCRLRKEFGRLQLLAKSAELLSGLARLLGESARLLSCRVQLLS